MKIAKRVLAAVTIVLLYCSVLFAGGASENKAKEMTGAGTKNPELNYVYINAAFNPDKEPIKQVLEDVSGYKTNYSMLPAENAAMKLNMDLASGNSYDLVRCDSSWFTGLYNQKALLPLNELIETYAPNIATAINPALFAATTVDGKIYGIPNGTPNPYGVFWGIAFRKDILDKHDIAFPDDLDSFTTCLREIKEKTGLIPFTATQPVVDHVLSAFGLSTYTKAENGKIVLRPLQKGMKEYLTYMNDLYEKGYIDSDLAINKSENVQEKFVSGQAVSILMTYGNETNQAVMQPALRANQPEAVLEYILPLKDEKGNRTIPQLAGVTDMVVIPVTSKHPEDAMKFINAILGDDESQLLAIGNEGEHYTFENGEYNPILPKFFQDRGNSWWLVPLNNQYTFPTFWSEIRIKKNMDVYHSFKELSKSSPYGVIDPIAYMPLTETRGKYEQKLKTMERDYYMQVICGAAPIKGYDKFVSQWLAAGGQQLTDDINEWYATKK